MRASSLIVAAGLAVVAAVGVEADSGSQRLTRAEKAKQALEAQKARHSEGDAVQGLRAKKADDGIDRAVPELRRAATAQRSLMGQSTSIEARSDGSLKARLGDEFLTDAVVVRNADGSIGVGHQRHSANPTFKSAPAPEKE